MNGTEVTGMPHSEVLQLLRSVSGTVELVISRQEMVEVEEGEEGEAATPTDASSANTTTVGKTLINVEIPLLNYGPSGLGISVHGRSGAKAKGMSGIFIKSILPGGAAAKVCVFVWVCACVGVCGCVGYGCVFCVCAGGSEMCWLHMCVRFVCLATERDKDTGPCYLES